MFIKIGELIFLQITPMDWGAEHLTNIVGVGGGGICQQKLPTQGRAFDQIFRMPEDKPDICPGEARGWNRFAHNS